jgi:hypothetical protein
MRMSPFHDQSPIAAGLPWGCRSTRTSRPLSARGYCTETARTGVQGFVRSESVVARVPERHRRVAAGVLTDLQNWNRVCCRPRPRLFQTGAGLATADTDSGSSAAQPFRVGIIGKFRLQCQKTHEICGAGLRELRGRERFKGVGVHDPEYSRPRRCGVRSRTLAPATRRPPARRPRARRPRARAETPSPRSLPSGETRSRVRVRS